MFHTETVQDTEIHQFNQDASQSDLDMNELYKWLERPITEEDEEYRDD